MKIWLNLNFLGFANQCTELNTIGRRIKEVEYDVEELTCSSIVMALISMIMIVF